MEDLLYENIVDITMPIGKNQRTIGSAENCGKSCLREYCWAHMAGLRHSPGTRPCNVCGKGVKNLHDLCQNCGYKKIFIQKWKRDNKAFQNEFHRLAMIEVFN
jgi:predicted amidophosphoribosyltransferase